MSFGQSQAIQLFRELFASHSAHIALIDPEGSILSVNDAWWKFGRENDLAEDYVFENVDYLDICHRASLDRSPLAQEAMLGILRVLKAGERSFSMLYPCHSPTQQRWFRMWVQTQQPQVAAVIVAHTYLGANPADLEENGQADRPAKGDRPVVLNAGMEYPWLYIGRGAVPAG